MYYNAKAALKTDSVFKQSKSYHPQVYVVESQYTHAENQQSRMLSDSDNDEYFEMKKAISPEKMRLL